MFDISFLEHYKYDADSIAWEVCALLFRSKRFIAAVSRFLYYRIFPIFSGLTLLSKQ